MFSNWFNAYLRSPIGLTDPALVYHSFRHTFQTFGELAGISEHVIDELIGHAPDNRYGRKEGRFKRLPFALLVLTIQAHAALVALRGSGITTAQILG